MARGVPHDAADCGRSAATSLSGTAHPARARPCPGREHLRPLPAAPVNWARASSCPWPWAGSRQRDLSSPALPGRPGQLAAHATIDRLWARWQHGHPRTRPTNRTELLQPAPLFGGVPCRPSSTPPPWGTATRSSSRQRSTGCGPATARRPVPHTPGERHGARRLADCCRSMGALSIQPRVPRHRGPPTPPTPRCGGRARPR